MIHANGLSAMERTRKVGGGNQVIAGVNVGVSSWLVCRDRLVIGGFRGVVMWRPLVADLGHVAWVAADVVGDLLAASVGEVNEVGALGGVAVGGLPVAVVADARAHSPAETVALGKDCARHQYCCYNQ